MLKKLLLGASLLTAASAAHAQAVVYGVDESNRLVTFNSNAPGTFLSTVQITGVNASIAAIDFRPLNGVLYGLGADKIVYTINPTTGAATAVSGPLAINGTEFGFDFNPTIDRLRITTNTNENYVFNPNDASLTSATAVAYASGDSNFGRDPDITALAYTSSVFGAAASTTQLYAIDTAFDILTKQANSAGTLTTVGTLGFDLGSRTSFDILGSNALAFNGNTLFNVNLMTGALSTVGTTNRALFGIALSGPVPEPATWAMMLLGFGGIGMAMRRRRKDALLQIA